MVLTYLFKLVSLYLSYKDRYRIAYYKHLHKDKLIFGKNVWLGRGSSIIFYPDGNKASITIGPNNTFRRRCLISLDHSGQLIIGANNFFNNNCSINCLSSITIGNDNLFGENVKLYDHNHKFSDLGKRIIDQGFSFGSISIGNNCWFGSNCTILSNVTIGNNVIIGANNLIFKSIPDNTIIKSNLTYTLTDRIDVASN
jgi:acetyltransferase-like isoleucine patch superfamily enzyme